MDHANAGKVTQNRSVKNTNSADSVLIEVKLLRYVVENIFIQYDL